jgi:hypothetical protein
MVEDARENFNVAPPVHAAAGAAARCAFHFKID